MKKIFVLFILMLTGSLAIAQFQCSNAMHQHNSRAPRDLRSDTFDIISTHLSMQFDFDNKMVYDTALLVLKAKMDGVTELRIDLEGSYEIALMQFNGVDVDYKKTTDTTGYILKLTSAASTNSNDLKIIYSGSPIKEAWGGFSWDGEYAYHIGVAFRAIPHSYGRVTFPCFDNFVEKSSYSFSLTCPSNKMANAVGTLISEEYGDSINTFVYTLDQSISSYLVGIHCGPYARVASNFEGIERIIPVEYYAKASDTAAMKNSFSNLVHAFDIYEKDFGPYPFDKVGYSLVPFTSGAMEHATNISYPIAFAQTGQGETTMAHELAHMWWGNQTTCENANMMWLNEGFASFCEFVFTAYVYGEEKYFEDVKSNQVATVTYAHIADSGYYAVNNVPLGFTYGRTTYDKGALVVNNLKNFVGNDSLFYDCMAQYLLNNKWGISTGESLQVHMEQYFDADFQGFFDAWVYGVGFPDFRLDYFNNEDKKGQLSQQLKATSSLAVGMPLELSFFDEDWNRVDKRVYLKGGCGEFSYADIDFEPVYVALDIDEKMADAGMSDYTVINKNSFKSFSDIGFKMRVEEITDGDSLMIHPTLHYAPPTPQERILLSNTHYWSIGGINLEAAKIGYLEFTVQGNLIDWDEEMFGLYTAENIQLFYRKDSRADWMALPDVTNNINGSRGNLRTANIQAGDYAIGVQSDLDQLANNYISHTTCDVLNVAEGIKERFVLYPNPSNGVINFENEMKEVKVFNIDGKLILNAEYAKSINIESKGLMFIQVKNIAGTEMRKVVLVN